MDLQHLQVGLRESISTVWRCRPCGTSRPVTLVAAVISSIIEGISLAGPYRVDYGQAAKQIAREIRLHPDELLQTRASDTITDMYSAMASQMQNASASMGIPESMMGQTRTPTATELAMMRQRDYAVSDYEAATQGMSPYSQTPEGISAAVKQLLEQQEARYKKQKERPKNNSITGRKFELE